MPYAIRVPTVFLKDSFRRNEYNFIVWNEPKANSVIRLKQALSIFCAVFPFLDKFPRDQQQHTARRRSHSGRPSRISKTRAYRAPHRWDFSDWKDKKKKKNPESKERITLCLKTFTRGSYFCRYWQKKKKKPFYFGIYYTTIFITSVVWPAGC